MNKTKYISFLFALTIGITLFFSCKKPDMPPVTPFSVGNTINIRQLRNLFVNNGCANYKFTKDVSLYATVTMDATSGNIYKMVYLRDSTGSISMKQKNAGGLFLGDSLRINLNGAYLDKASSGAFLQIDSVDVSSGSTNKIIKEAIGKNPAPVTVTLLQLLNSITINTCTLTQSVYDGQLVQLNDVQFDVADTGLQFIPTPTSGPTSSSYFLTDCGGLNSIGIYTSSFATEFYQKKVPAKSGSLVAIASLYTSGTSTTIQLTLRSMNEINLTQPRCGVDTLTQSFTNFNSSSANFATTVPGWYDINYSGYIKWLGNTSGTSCFPIASNYGSGTSQNDMWLITPPIQSGPTKNLNFQVATDYWNANQLTVKISTDFNGTNLGGPNFPSPTPAHWTDITASFPKVTAGNLGTYFFYDASPSPVQLSQFLPVNYTGTFYIGFCYTGHLSDSTSTYAIDNVSIKN